MKESKRTNIVHRENGIITYTVQITWLSGITTGWGNGYFALPKNHKWYGKDYDDIPIECNGGLTFSQEQKIESETYWVIGFDCAHAYDNPSKDEKWLINQMDEIYTNQLAG